MKKTKLPDQITVLRVVVQHKDKTNPGYKPAHYGPAFDQAYQTVAGQMRGVDPSQVDLEKDAKDCLVRANQEFPAKAGWQVTLQHFDNNAWTEVK